MGREDGGNVGRDQSIKGSESGDDDGVFECVFSLWKQSSLTVLMLANLKFCQPPPAMRRFSGGRLTGVVQEDAA